MIQLITIIIVAIWTMRIAGNLLTYIHLWYVKEYRLDRMWIHLTKTKQGRQLPVLPFRRPPTTPKTLLLGGLAGVSLGLIFWLMTGHWLFKFLVADLVTFPLVSFWVLLTGVPTRLLHKVKIRLAVRRLRLYPQMRVIGITGSFGKTSTKENMAAILASSHSVLKTEASINSPIGIAEVVLEKLRPDHDVFIVEMGAYKRGEIAYMSRMVKPHVGIITAINPQHQDLFMSIAATKAAKYELIQHIPPTGVAIFNADNEGTLELARKAKKEGRVVWVYSKRDIRTKGEFDFLVRAEKVEVETFGIEFTLVVGQQKSRVKAAVLGEHQVDNILAAVAGALALGMKLPDIVKGIRIIKPYPKTMQPVPGVGGALFINDTFNNNPDAAKAAIRYLAHTKGKKILVFQPMIELGSFTAAAHREVGKLAGQICNEIFLTNANWLEHFEAGTQEAGFRKQIHVVSPKNASVMIRKLVTKGDTVVFKGKEAENVLSALGAV